MGAILFVRRARRIAAGGRSYNRLPRDRGRTPANIVMPAQAGIQSGEHRALRPWIPAYAGMTVPACKSSLLGVSDRQHDDLY